MVRRIWLCLALTVVLLPFFSAPAPASAAPAHQTGSCTNTLSQPAGQPFWVGAPAAANAGGPVVVFVHGYTSDHNTWSGSNYAVRDACNNGFRVAAVDLGGTSSIWDNGNDLKNKLQAIASYYGVAKVNVMAHSKGGLDTQTAIVHSGASPLVQRYVAFASPFGGTDLADHACAWYGWALWQCNDATWTMRTGYMSYVRSITDNRTENDGILAYALRGSKCNWYDPACGMIAGSDDGVVPTWSVWSNGRDSHISDRSDLRHGEVHQTQFYNTAWLFSYLGRATAQAADAPTAKAEPHLASSNYTLRGGDLAGKVTESVLVEGGLDAVSFHLLSTGGARVTLLSPTGQRYEARGTRTDAGAILQGIAYAVRVERPEAGAWQVLIERADKSLLHAGYLLQATYEGGVSVQLATNLATVYQPGSTLSLALVPNKAVTSLTFASTLRGDGNVALGEGLSSAVGQSLALPATSGTYNLDLRISGIAADGTPFERTLVTSLAAVDLAKVSAPASIR